MGKKRLLIGICALSMMSGQLYAADASSSLSSADKLSYSLGYLFGTNLKQTGTDIDQKKLTQGLNDALNGNKPLLSDQAQQQTLEEFQNQMIQKAQAEQKQQASANADTGKKFLVENSKKPGVVTLADGLQYKVLTKGNGPIPKPTDSVTVNYEGRLINGQVFDSSYKRGQPATFQLNQVIKGWTEALSKMPVGSTWELYIPADLAYGDRALPGIPANSTLIFKVELLSINGSK